MSQQTEISRHSDEVQEVMAKVPPWIVQWGIVIFGIVLIAVVTASAFIPYPNTLRVPVRILTSKNSSNVNFLAEVSQDSYMKVKLGQAVLIHLKVYPAEDYMPLKGVISTISTEPDNKGTFLITIKLVRSKENSGRSFKNWMNGSAEVILENKTIIQKIIKNSLKFS